MKERGASNMIGTLFEIGLNRYVDLCDIDHDLYEVFVNRLFCFQLYRKETPRPHSYSLIPKTLKAQVMFSQVQRAET